MSTNDGLRREDLTAWYEQTLRSDALVAIGEGKAAVDQIRRKVNIARSAPPEDPLAYLRVLAQYAVVLENTDAMAEAEYVWVEASELIASTNIATRDAAEAFLRHGLLLAKMHNYDGAVRKLKEAVDRTEALEGIEELDRQIMLARAWRGQAQAFEALGEFSQASATLDTLMNVKRQIRFIAFAAAR